MKWLLVFAIFSSCSIPFQTENFVVAKTISPRKQRQKITALQKKLEIAEREQEKVFEEVEELRREMHLAQIHLIQRQVDDFLQEMEKYRDSPEALAKRLPYDLSSLFLTEREELHKMIQTGPSPSSFDAQVVLDQILRMITNLSDDARKQ